jgi:hypothetical protein
MVEIDFLLPSMGKTIQALNGVQIRFDHAEYRFQQSLILCERDCCIGLERKSFPRKPHLQADVGNSSEYWSD